MSVSVGNPGLIVQVNNTGKSSKLIPWSHVKKTTIARGVKKCEAPKYGIEIYLVDKTVDGNKLDAVYNTERDALRAVDIFLIENGREPEHILKRL